MKHKGGGNGRAPQKNREGSTNKKSYQRAGKMEVEMNKCGQAVSLLIRRTSSYHTHAVSKGGRQAWWIRMIDVWTHGAAAPAAEPNEMCPTTR